VNFAAGADAVPGWRRAGKDSGPCSYIRLIEAVVTHLDSHHRALPRNNHQAGVGHVGHPASRPERLIRRALPAHQA